MDDFDGAPGLLYRPYEQMQDLYEKLVILKYHEECVKMAKIRPIHSLYFTTSMNPGEQYYNFVSIASWLIKKCNRSINMPQESDDPNMVISGILEHIRSMDGKIEYGPSKVKSGSGPEVVSALSFLATEALKATNVDWEELNKDDLSDGEDEVIILEEQEVNLDKIEEEMEQIYSSDEDDDAGWIQNSSNADIGHTDEQQKMLKSDVDVESWRLELERVLPQLKITVKTDGQDWRWRQEQMRTHISGISETVNQIEGPLKRLVSEAQGVSEKVLSRETFLNSQFSGLLDELHQSQEKISKMKEVHRDLSNKVTEKNKSLAHFNEELEQTRQQLEDRGSIMADGAPVVTTRKNLNSLKKEFGDMEVEIGVMEHSLMKSLVQEQMILRDKNKL